MSESVTFTRISKSFGANATAQSAGKNTNGAAETAVLTKIDLQIRAGEFVAIVGPSGCGKSTLLRLIAGLEQATTGTVAIGDHPVQGVDRRCALMFQEPRLLPWKTIRQNVQLAVRGSEQQYAEQWLTQVGLQGFIHAMPHQLSGGMAQRAALARALVGSPQVLLLDEPFAALDALTKLQMQDLLVDTVQSAGATVVMVTHDIDEAVYLADRVVILGQRPATIVATYHLAIPRPRDRSHPALAAQRGQILEHFGLAHHKVAPPTEVF
ncbi:MAG: ABC transporter ATP-binding protein [Caldilineaceae bacterium]|nr:ABC transporter ATP-binding protein [Caldilineaceae bacterium]